MSSAATVLPFIKASACGNDFLIVDLGAQESSPSADLQSLTIRLCKRHTGVGADGVEWLFASPQADVQARLINADGSEAEISGNGTRCVAAYICSEQKKEQVSIGTGAGVKLCTLTSRTDSSYEFEIAMGKPVVSEELTLRLLHREISGVPVSMGNPHYVVFVNEFSNAWQAEAAKIQQQPVFAQGVNIEFVKVADDGNIEVRFFERGVGETRSSGTGSCASAVAAISSHRAKSPLRVHALGGSQSVRWDDQVFLRGTAQLVCRGEFFV